MNDFNAEFDPIEDDVAPQSEVLDWYRDNDNTEGAVTVGLYIRVVMADHTRLTTMGPVDGEEFGWRIVEVNWKDNEMLLAPKTDLQRSEN